MYKNRIKYRINNPFGKLFLLFVLGGVELSMLKSSPEGVCQGNRVEEKGICGNVFWRDNVVKIVLYEY